MKRTVFSLLTALLVAGAFSQPATFDATWHDGRAEIDGYDLTVNRYGEDRAGQAVMIFVTEPFIESERVKANSPADHPDDVFDALKLNLVRDFQTGIYDYNTMVSVFTHADDFSPSKITFTSAEWCGHVYEEQLYYPDRVDHTVASYFEGESTQTELDAPPNAMAEDALYIYLRGLRGAPLEAGETMDIRLMPSSFYRRLRHLPAGWVGAVIERMSGAVSVEVPAGTFDTNVYEVRVDDGRVGRFHIETAWPHRIIAWEWEGMESGRLRGSERLPYWQLNHEGDESNLEQIGVMPLP